MTSAARREAFDLTTLQRYLGQVLPELSGPMALEAASGGLSNPTYFLRFANRTVVLRKQPAGPLASSAHAIHREYRVLQALTSTTVCVPQPLHYCDDKAVIGTPFYIMECVDGLVIPDASLAKIERQNRRSIYFSIARTLGALHRLDWQALGLGDFGRPGNFFERQLARWSRSWREQGLGDNDDLDAVIAWLSSRIPDDQTASISHGDFRFANVVIAPDHSTISGVLDWELSTIGHPFFDVGYFCMAYHTAPEENGGLLGLDLNALGIPSKEEFLQEYKCAAGTDHQVTLVHEVFALFRASAGSESVASRAASGQGVDANAASVGRKLGRAYARRARELIATCKG